MRGLHSKQKGMVGSSLVFLALRAVHGALHVDDEIVPPAEDELAQSVLSTIPPGVYYAASGMEFIEVGETGGRVVLRKGRCVRAYGSTGRLREETWYVDGKDHRVDGPSCRRWDEAGRLWMETWRVAGKDHRVDGPALRWWDEVGRLWVEQWCVDGKEHRGDGPSYLRWDGADRLRAEGWCVDGKEHRVDGPSYRVWDEVGGLCEERWCVDGVPVDPPACCRK